MTWLKSIWTEGVGLFIDDGSLAVAVAAWLIACRFLLPFLKLAPAWPPTLLAAGLILILAESVIRRARLGK